MTPDGSVFAALLAVEGVQWLSLSDAWPLLDSLCREHELMGNALSDGWIAATVLARRETLVTFNWEFLVLLPRGQLLVLQG